MPTFSIARGLNRLFCWSGYEHSCPAATSSFSGQAASSPKCFTHTRLRRSGLRHARDVVARRPFPLSARQQIDRIKVRAILRGDGRAGKHDADASHLSEAAEAGCLTFVTWDSKILRKRDTLRAALPSGISTVLLGRQNAFFYRSASPRARTATRPCRPHECCVRPVRPEDRAR